VGSADKRRSACGRRPRSEIIAAIALAISFESAVAAGVSLFLSFRESARRDEEIRLLRDEAGRREEELSLIRQQVERDREEREIAKRANLKMTPGSSSSSPQEITFDVLVANAGPHFASDLLVRLRDADGHIVGESSHCEPLSPARRQCESRCIHRHQIATPVPTTQNCRGWTEWAGSSEARN